MTVLIRDGWHIYANPAGLAAMKPTTLALDPLSQETAPLLNVSYPQGELKVLGSVGTERVALYERRVEFKARMKLADDARPGPAKVVLRLSFQACNDRLCQAPATLEIPLAVTIGP